MLKNPLIYIKNIYILYSKSVFSLFSRRVARDRFGPQFQPRARDPPRKKRKSDSRSNRRQEME